MIVSSCLAGREGEAGLLRAGVLPIISDRSLSLAPLNWKLLGMDMERLWRMVLFWRVLSC